MKSQNNNNNNDSKYFDDMRPDRCVGFNISMPLAELDKVDQLKRQLGISRSELMRRAFNEFSSRSFSFE